LQSITINSKAKIGPIQETPTWRSISPNNQLVFMQVFKIYVLRGGVVSQSHKLDAELCSSSTTKI
jgi:hypothetical protein